MKNFLPIVSEINTELVKETETHEVISSLLNWILSLRLYLLSEIPPFTEPINTQ